MANTYTLIESQVLGSSAASVTFSAIPATYTDLVLRYSARHNNAFSISQVLITFNGDTAANYSETVVYGNSVSAASPSERRCLARRRRTDARAARRRVSPHRRSAQGARARATGGTRPRAGTDGSCQGAACVQCGQCAAVCPTAAIIEKDHIERVWAALADKTKHVVVQTAPAIRAGLGECFGLPTGTLVTGKMVSSLRRIGFHAVFDTNFAADLTIMEEGTELAESTANNNADRHVNHISAKCKLFELLKHNSFLSDCILFMKIISYSSFIEKYSNRKGEPRGTRQWDILIFSLV